MIFYIQYIPMANKFVKLVISSIITLCILSCAQASASSANMDTIFDTGLPIWFDGPVTAMKIQNDGKIIIGGNFSSYKGITANRIARLNADGTIDSTANFWWRFNNGVNTIAVQNDGKIIVGGIFTTYSWSASNRIVRLNADGTKDTSFDIWGGFNNTVNTIAIQNDGKILVGGNFSSYSWSSSNSIIRLNNNGTIDTGFIVWAGFNVAPTTITIQSGGKIFVGGQFTAYNWTTAYFIIRLNNDGSIDTGFNYWAWFQNRVNTIAIQNDGKVVMGWMFTSYSGTAANRIIRLNDNGSIDTGFIVWGWFNATNVNIIKIQDDGRLVVGWDFTSYSWSISNRIIRLNSDGSKDVSFNIWSGFNIWVNDIWIQSGGKIVVGGNFTNYNGTTTNRITRLNTDGTIDNSLDLGQGFDDRVLVTTTQNNGKVIVWWRFTSYGWFASNNIAYLNADWSRDSSFIIWSGFNNDVFSIGIQSDGKILVGGQFTTYNWTTWNRIIRLNTDGSKDTSLTIWIGFNNNVTNIIPQSGGKILIAGTFTNYSWTPANRIIRLNSDGTVDGSFKTWNGFATNGVNILAIQSDGKIIAGGQFTAYSWTSSNRIVRLNADGSIDTGFTVGSGFNSDVQDIGIQSDGKIVVGWNFTNYNGTIVNYIARLNTGGTIDTGFNSWTWFNFNIYSIAIQTDDKIIVGGQFTAYSWTTANRIIRLNSDGSRDSSLNIWIGYNDIVTDIKIQNDGKVLVGWWFTTYNWIPAWYLTSLYGDAPVVELPNTSDTGTINTAFITKWYTETGWVLSGSVPISLELTDGKIPTILEITNQNISLSLSWDTQFKQSDNVTNYTGTISVPVIKEISSINDQNVISAINVGSTSEIIILTGWSSTISIPVPTQTVGQTIQVSSSQNNGVTWYPEVITQVIDKNWIPTVEFNTDKLADFALTETIDTIVPTASVTYSITWTTNQNVVATITGFSEAITWLNATGYTFTVNGTFTFTFEDIAGNTGSTTATVNWIDKTMTGGGGGGGGSNSSNPSSWWISVINESPSLNGSGIHQTGSIVNSRYPSEQNDAYLWAYNNDITTMNTIQKANIDGPLIRKDMAKMVSNFAINVLHKAPSTWTICKYPDISLVTEEMRSYILLSCKLWLMWFESNGITLKKTFDPEMVVDRAQFGTILSRLIRAGKYNWGYPYYVKHLNALKNAGIMTKISTPFQEEIRWYVMIMMMRAIQ